MTNIYKYASISVALKQLRKEGFTYDFNQNSEEIILHPENYIINQIYQYEENSSPDDSAIVYAIVSKFGLKGVFVTGTSANSSDENAEIVSKLAIKNKHTPTL